MFHISGFLNSYNSNLVIENLAKFITICPRLSNIYKKVTFSNQINAILVPTKNEFIKAGLYNYIWWNSSDYKCFERDAVHDIRDYVYIKNVDILTAINELYQPNPNHF